MRISAIVAMSANRVIGHQNQLPWHMPADLKHFKKVTMSKPIIMGRKTYQSIGKPLPGRLNIIVTRDVSFEAPGCLVFNNISHAIKAAASDEVFIIGGAELFQQMLPDIQRLYLTVIHKNFEGDAFFPELDMNEWFEVEKEDHEADEKNPANYSFILLDRKG